MLVHPQFDPIAVQLGPLAIHWYGLMYLAGFMAFLAEVGAEQNVAEQTKTRWAMGQSAAGPSRPAGPATKARARAQASRPSRVRRR